MQHEYGIKPEDIEWIVSSKDSTEKASGGASKLENIQPKGIFPIMHAVAIRKDVVQAHSWLPRAVFLAYSQAKQLMYDSIRQSAWYKTSLPWVAQEAEGSESLMRANQSSESATSSKWILLNMLDFDRSIGIVIHDLDTGTHRRLLDLNMMDGGGTDCDSTT